MPRETIILATIFLPLIFLSYHLPSKLGKKNVGKSVGILSLGYFLIFGFWLEAIFVLLALSPLFIFLLLFNLIWLFKLIERPIIGLTLAGFGGIVFLGVILEPTIKEKMFSDEDAVKMLKSQGLQVAYPVELISNDWGGLIDHAHVFEVELNEYDYQALELDFTTGKGFLGDMGYDKRLKHFETFDTLRYSEPGFWVKEYSLYPPEKDGTSHVWIRLNKAGSSLEYYAQ